MTATQDINELKSDLRELETVLGVVTRSNVRSIIADAISTLRTKVDHISRNQVHYEQQQQQRPPIPKPTLFTAKISNYGWDEGQKLIKVYIAIPDISKLTQDQVTADFTEDSFKIFISNHNGKNHILEILKLAGKINKSASTCRVKSGNVIVTLKKIDATVTWGCLTEAEKKSKEKKDSDLDPKKNEMDTGGDPSAGIMNLMKKMYDEGDDEMKRTIKKTWYESQQKQRAGEMPGMPDMGAAMGGHTMPGMSAMGMAGMGGMPGMAGMSGMGGLNLPGMQ